MPQFEPATITTQIFWLVITFGVLYFALWKTFLPKIADTLAQRQEKIDDDLDRAAAFKKEAEEVLADYERSVAETQQEALALIKQAQDEMAAEAAKSHEALAGELAEKVIGAEREIEKAREAATANIDQVAAETARSAVERLIGVSVDEAAASQAVASAAKGA